MASRSVFGRVLLVTGGQEFLSERAVRAAVDGIAAQAPEADVAEVVASSMTPGELTAITSPSLFSDTSGVVVRELEDLPAASHDELLQFAASPSPDVACVLAHGGGNKAKGLLDKLRACAAVTEVKTGGPKPWELTGWVSAEVRQAGGSITDEAAGHLVAAVGQDLRALAAAADQLVAAATTAEGKRGRLDIELVRQYFGGRAEVRGFDIADLAVEGKRAEALEQLRWAIANGVASVLVTSAFASGLRSLARYGAARDRGLGDADLAREVGAPPFRLKVLGRQLRGWDADGLADAIGAVARADLAVKGGAGDPDHALEQMVLTVVGCRT
ncbi:MAG: DNA polymerase III subunit delta [Nocardioidaceae bacterium]|nr:DNA polymerase III subunit delta [Nocardioidaceae bacterium]